MQMDIITLFLTALALFITIGLTAAFTDVWNGLFGRIKERRNPEIQIRIEQATHIHDRGLFLHNMRMSFSNTTETETRIDNIKFFDKKKRELEYVTRGMTGIITSFDIRGNASQFWSIFCHRQPTGETNLVKLKVCIYRVGKRTICKTFESRLVSERQFDSGDWFIIY